MKTNNVLFLSLIMFLFLGCTNNSEKGTNEKDTISVEKGNNEYSCTFTDNRDEKTYRCIKIGEQVWMAENLSYLPEVNAVSFDGHGYWVYDYNGTDIEEAKKQIVIKNMECCIVRILLKKYALLAGIYQIKKSSKL